MSYADKLFVEMCQSILENGTDTKGEDVRPVWKDTGDKAYTIKTFGVVHEYDLRKEFPLLTLRPIGLKSAINEIRWIYQKKSNNIEDLKPHIWDSWADDNGSIGKAYGYQVGKVSVVNYIKGFFSEGETKEERDRRYFKLVTYDPLQYKSLSAKPISQDDNTVTFEIKMDQMDNLLYGLQNEPFGRRHMINLYNVDELHEMNLYPCCWSLVFNVTRENGELVLNMVLNQRSNDILAANGWNVAQYAALLMMIARHVKMIPGKFLHVIADAHIYDRHVGTIKELIEREQFDAPQVYIREGVNNFYDITEDDFVIEDYNHGAPVKGIDVAV